MVNDKGTNVVGCEKVMIGRGVAGAIRAGWLS